MRPQPRGPRVSPRARVRVASRVGDEISSLQRRTWVPESKTSHVSVQKEKHTTVCRYTRGTTRPGYRASALAKSRTLHPGVPSRPVIIDIIVPLYAYPGDAGRGRDAARLT